MNVQPIFNMSQFCAHTLSRQRLSQVQAPQQKSLSANVRQQSAKEVPAPYEEKLSFKTLKHATYSALNVANSIEFRTMAPPQESNLFVCIAQDFWSFNNSTADFTSQIAQKETSFHFKLWKINNHQNSPSIMKIRPPNLSMIELGRHKFEKIEEFASNSLNRIDGPIRHNSFVYGRRHSQLIPQFHTEIVLSRLDHINPPSILKPINRRIKPSSSQSRNC